MDWMTILIIAVIALVVGCLLLWAANNYDMIGDLLGQ